MGVRTRGQAAQSPALRQQPKLPVTLLSGFLGAGKTTLLRHVLKNKEDLKCAIIVNDMAEINIDASLIKNVSLVQAEEKLVEMQNGCICCTLREDLIEEVSRLAKQKRFDYLLIESTGISEPMQVAETFDMDIDGKALRDVAKLDTCVTVVDAANLNLNLNSIQKVKEQSDAKGDDEEDERNIADLLIDQIEFADIIILNKTDLVTESQLKQLTALLTSLNPGATLLPTTESKVPLKAILSTGRFDLDKAQKSAGWLQSLITNGPVVPESEEYGISSFIYRARKAFHPQRLWDFVNCYFAVEQPVVHTHEEDNEGKVAAASKGDDFGDQEVEAKADDPWQMEGKTQKHSSGDGVILDAEEIALKQKDFHSKFGQVLRAKGFFWLANRDSIGGEWSQAGTILRLSSGSPWFDALPKEAWSDVNELEVMKDFEDGVGDRRQELVFIGQHINQGALVAALNACLCTEQEATEAAQLEDPFDKWPEFVLEYEEVSDDESEVEGEVE